MSLAPIALNGRSWVTDLEWTPKANALLSLSGHLTTLVQIKSTFYVWYLMSVFLCSASSISLQVSEIGQKQNWGHARKVEENVIDWLEPHLSTVVIALPEVNISSRPALSSQNCSLFFLREWRVSSSSHASSASSSSTWVQRRLRPQIHRRLVSGPLPLLFHKSTNSPKTTCWPPFRKWPRNGKCLLK